MDDFKAHRPLLFGIAYRMLSSVSVAEDIVQDAYLCYTAAPRESVRSPRSFLATINAGPGVILREAGKPIVVMSFEFEDGQICGLRLVAHPDKSPN